MSMLAAVLTVCLAGAGQQQAPAVTPQELAAAIDALGSLDDARRAAASRTVRRADAALAEPALVKAAREHADGYVRYRALVLAGGLAGATANDLMQSVLGDRNDRLRATAYAWFEHHPDPAVLPKLLAALDTEQSEFVRPSLTRALAAADADRRVQQVLVPLVSKGQDYFRAEVIQALGDYKADYAGDAILAVAQLDGPLQEEAILAVGKIGNRAALPALAELQRSVPRERQPSLAAAICLLGVNCATHEAFLVDTLKFAAGAGPAYQPLLRSAAHALGVLAVRGDAPALKALLDAGVPAPDPRRAPIALAVGLVALRNSALVLDALEARPDRDAAIGVLRDAFDMLEEDFEEEQFYVTVRHAYWAAPAGSARRQLAAALIEKLEF